MADQTANPLPEYHIYEEIVDVPPKAVSDEDVSQSFLAEEEHVKANSSVLSVLLEFSDVSTYNNTKLSCTEVATDHLKAPVYQNTISACLTDDDGYIQHSAFGLNGTGHPKSETERYHSDYVSMCMETDESMIDLYQPVWKLETDLYMEILDSGKQKKSNRTERHCYRNTLLNDLIRSNYDRQMLTVH